LLRRAASKLKGMRSKRPLLAMAGATFAVLAGLWFAANSVGWAGPIIADVARSVIGPEAVSGLEDFAYGIEDRWNTWRWRTAKPEAYWDAPPSAGEPESPPRAEPDMPAPELLQTPEFRPADVGPLFREMAAKGDGTWVPVVDPAHHDDPPLLYKTLIHPDKKRSWSELFVVAIDLRRTQLFAAAGTLEPKPSTEEGAAYKRRGVVPEGRRDALVAAFDGGFKAEHGSWGMKVDGVTLLPPRDRGCTVAGYADESVRIGTWTALADTSAEMTFWRQTPSCIVENGNLNPGLVNEESISWGAALGGGTVVRRSAVGLNADQTVLYMGVGNATTARAIALGMQHAGAVDVAQLDINWSYPHFIMFRPPKNGNRQGFTLFDGFAYEENEYITRSSTRDFFYLVRRDASLTQRER
jgi:hypothetical protein